MERSTISQLRDFMYFEFTEKELPDDFLEQSIMLDLNETDRRILCQSRGYPLNQTSVEKIVSDDTFISSINGLQDLIEYHKMFHDIYMDINKPDRQFYVFFKLAGKCYNVRMHELEVSANGSAVAKTIVKGQYVKMLIPSGTLNAATGAVFVRGSTIRRTRANVSKYIANEGLFESARSKIVSLDNDPLSII